LLLLLLRGRFLPGILLVLVEGAEVEVAVLAQELLQLQPLLNLLAEDLQNARARSRPRPDVAAGQRPGRPSPGLVVGPQGAGVVVEIAGKVRGGVGGERGAG